MSWEVTYGDFPYNAELKLYANIFGAPNLSWRLFAIAGCIFKPVASLAKYCASLFLSKSIAMSEIA